MRATSATAFRISSVLLLCASPALSLRATSVLSSSEGDKGKDLPPVIPPVASVAPAASVALPVVKKTPKKNAPKRDSNTLTRLKVSQTFLEACPASAKAFASTSPRAYKKVYVNALPGDYLRDFAVEAERYAAINSRNRAEVYPSPLQKAKMAKKHIAPGTPKQYAKRFPGSAIPFAQAFPVEAASYVATSPKHYAEVFEVVSPEEVK
jgi:hypothetical protein